MMLQLEFTPLILLFSASFLVTVGLGFAALRRRMVRGTAVYAGTMFALAYWTLCYLLELASVTPDAKMFWAAAKYPGAVAVPVLWLVLAIQLSGASPRFNRRAFRVILAVCAAVGGLVAITNPMYHWFWTDNIVLLLTLLGLFCASLLLRTDGSDLVTLARASVIQNIEAGVFVLDSTGKVLDLNPFAQELVGMDAAHAVGKPIHTVLPTLDPSKPFQDEVTIRRESAVSFFHVQTTPLKAPDGSAAGQTLVLLDITARKLAERELERLTRTDVLTGIMNHRYFFERADEEFARAERYHYGVAILMLRPDRFQELNETHGHPVGDQALKLIAAECRALARESDLLARYGSEQFIWMLLPGTRQEALTTAERVRQRVENITLEHNGTPFRVTVSIGAAHQSFVGDLSLREMIERADRTLDRAQSGGQNRVVEWDARADI